MGLPRILLWCVLLIPPVSIACAIAYIVWRAVDLGPECTLQFKAPIATGCLNSIWAKSGCTTAIPDAYSGWWKSQSLDAIREDMKNYGALTDPADARYRACRVKFQS